MEWLSIISIIVSIICVLGVGLLLVDIWKGRNGYGKKRKVGEKYPNYDDWGDPENLEPVDDWDKKKELD